MDELDSAASLGAIKHNDDLGVYKTLLESTKAIPWKMNWHTKQFDYIGPQIEFLLGWKQQSWQSAMDWIERIHPDDRETTANYCIQQSENGVDHEADYRALKADGGYVWIREVVHVIRDKDGVTTNLIGFMFDISERKRMEEELIALNKRLEALSCKDVLTGVSNRHHFKLIFDAEWSRAVRSGTPISMLMFDIDHFKQFNDRYGHVLGDQCLIRVAHSINDLSLRATDLFARYGGEEFILVLPETSIEAAVQMAEKCRNAVFELGIEHDASETCDRVTVSIGVASIIPDVDTDGVELIEHADQMLYQAKKSGRNRVCSR